ncbi:hypothetical protein DPMN_050246 [Dreissena polymorpha]|uniref:RING-type domain-containing protein n=1 Tax=Dreissena polymorpha TaxID=45954 RepID=A0A9D4CHG6_DREPO|nr:hypothetical protein DPMN_050246 [Dreissena polymorpha]
MVMERNQQPPVQRFRAPGNLPALSSSLLCLTCKQRPSIMLLLPCSHLAVCDQCARTTELCPRCTRPVMCIIRTVIL